MNHIFLYRYNISALLFKNMQRYDNNIYYKTLNLFVLDDSTVL